MAIKHILVPSDFSQTAKSALTCALSIAKTSGAKITLLHIVTVYNDDPYRDDQPFPSLEEYYEQMEQKADGLFEKEISTLGADKVSIERVVRRGFSSYEEILTYAAENDVDLIAIGTHGRKPVARFFLGSVAENIVHRAHCPVLTVRIEDDEAALPDFKRILVAIDFYEQSEQALQLALSILPQGGILDLLHVVEDVIPPTYFAAEGETIFDIMPQVKIKTKDSLQKVADKLVPENVQRNLIIREGKVAATIIDVAKERKSDIIVMGTHSMNALAQILIGSQANKVIRKAHCPVLTTK